MNPQFLYREDPLTLEFEAAITQKLALPDERIGVILDSTYFYPTGGGQEHDTGTLGEARVSDVFKDETETAVIHVIDRDLPLGPVHAAIDHERRLRHMQHHTAQHLLTQCFVRLFGYDTVSANINGDSPSTLDLATAASLSKAGLDRAEDLANQIVYENRPVKSYFVAPDRIHTIPLRKQPTVTEDIRIIEIDAYDYAACGGTHCTQTGMIGAVKILKAERQNDKTRIHFIAGIQAMQYLRMCFDIVTGLAGQLSTHPQDVTHVIERQTEQLKAAQRELQTLRMERIGVEARELAAHAETLGPHRVALAAFEGRPVVELRALADEFKKMPGVIALLATYDGQKISLAAVCSEDTGVSAQALLKAQLTRIGGKGGGDARVAQGGGIATEEQFKTFFEETRSLVQGLLSASTAA